MNDKKLKADFLVKYPTSEDIVEIALGVEDEMKDMPFNEENAVKYVKSIKSLIHNMIDVRIHDAEWPALCGICSSKEEQRKNGQESRKESWLATVFLLNRESYDMEFDKKPSIEWRGEGDSLSLQIKCDDLSASFSHAHVIGFSLSKE